MFGPSHENRSGWWSCLKVVMMIHLHPNKTNVLRISDLHEFIIHTYTYIYKYIYAHLGFNPNTGLNSAVIMLYIRNNVFPHLPGEGC